MDPASLCSRGGRGCRGGRGPRGGRGSGSGTTGGRAPGHASTDSQWKYRIFPMFGQDFFDRYNFFPTVTTFFLQIQLFPDRYNFCFLKKGNFSPHVIHRNSESVQVYFPTHFSKFFPTLPRLPPPAAPAQALAQAPALLFLLNMYTTCFRQIQLFPDKIFSDRYNFFRPNIQLFLTDTTFSRQTQLVSDQTYNFLPTKHTTFS